MTKKISTYTNPLYTLGVLHKSENFKKWYADNTISFKKYRSDWTDRPTNSKYGNFPLSLNVEITTKCNLACTFCWHSSLKEDEKIHLEFEDFKKIIDEASSFKIPSINLNGLGEPITHPRLLDMVEYCKMKGVQDIMFHTNGTKLSDKRIKDLITSGLTQIIFSLDTPDKDTYEKVRIGAKFDKVNSNVEQFIKIKKEMKSILPLVRVTMVLTDETIHQVDQFKKKWEGKADHITTQELLFSSDVKESSEESVSWKSKEKSYYSVDKQELLEFEKKRGIGFKCPYLYQSLKIKSDKTVLACSPRNAPKLGRLDDGLSNIWQNEKINNLRKLHEEGKWYKVKECISCDIPFIEINKIKNNK